ncbi:tyrosine-type recombinase/integrase [Photobacterium leiognathi]|uniref:tyrosine-type recombinase/integrase n=1 Tax=Photobacterium leiognathi TaxID=553611 RepID=UPI002980CC91|nr:site-specific integrase [Photobacterium leiognathi]
MGFDIALQGFRHDTMLKLGRYVIPFHLIAQYPTLTYINSLRSPLSRQKVHYTLNRLAESIGFRGNKSLPAHCFIEWQSFNEQTVSLLMTTMRNHNVGKARLNSYLNAIKKTCERALMMDLISQKQLTGIQLVKPFPLDRTRKAKTLELEQVIGLFQTNGSTGNKRHRDNAMLAILFGCGLRRSEVLSLSTDSLFVERGELFLSVVGKGDKRRSVPVPQSTSNYLKLWLKTRSISIEQCVQEKINKPLFVHVSTRNKINEAKALTSSNHIYTIIKERCDEKNLPSCSPHDARRTVATLLYNQGVPIERIKDILGHSHIDTTKRYIFVDSNVYSEAVAGLRF